MSWAEARVTFIEESSKIRQQFDANLHYPAGIV